MIARPAPNSGSGFLRRNLRLLDHTYAIAATFSGCHNAWQHGEVHGMAWTALSARLYRWQSRVSSIGWRFGSASDQVAPKEYQVLILTPEGHILDRHTLTCADDDEAKETARVLAESSTVEVWKGPVRIVRFEPVQ
jgi:hypothetical protein